MARIEQNNKTSVPENSATEIIVDKEMAQDNNFVDNTVSVSGDTMVNCLRNEKVIARHIYKQSGLFDNPKHVFAGGMAENAVRVYSVPRLSSGNLVNVLTNSEKEYLENILGLPMNALSIYKTKDNYWTSRYVRLGKEDNIFDLSNPEQYIDYKILLSNSDKIAPSLSALEDYPKSTYEYVLINEQDETSKAKQYMSSIQMSYKEFGKIENDTDTLRLILEMTTGRSAANSSKLEWLQTQVNNIIQNDSKRFLQIVTDPLLKTKVLIKKGIENGSIQRRNNLLYFNGEPLCEYGEESTLNNAAKYLNAPKHQEVLFTLQASIKN